MFERKHWNAALIVAAFASGPVGADTAASPHLTKGLYAEAGPNLFVLPGETVHLSNRAGHSPQATARWTQVMGPDVTIHTNEKNDVQFVAPASAWHVGVVMELQVTDDKDQVARDRVLITVLPDGGVTAPSGPTITW